MLRTPYQAVKRLGYTAVRIELFNLWLRTLLKIGQKAPFSLARQITLPIVGVVEIELDQLKIRFESNDDDSIVEMLYWHGLDSFESETIRLFRSLLSSANYFVDIGANTGLYTLLAACLYPNLQVYAFEPVPEIAARLQANIKQNQLANVEMIPCVVSDIDGELPVYIPQGRKKLTTNASTRADFRRADRIIQICSVTLDSFIKNKKIPAIDLLKIDTEATEPAVLAGGLEILRQHKPLIICEVLYGRTEEALHNLLDSEEYRYFWIVSNGLIPKDSIEGDITYKCMNYLFVPENKMDMIKPFLNTDKN